MQDPKRSALMINKSVQNVWGGGISTFSLDFNEKPVKLHSTHIIFYFIDVLKC